jgi:hypothetical protein
MTSLELDAMRYRWLREHFKFANDSMCELWFDICLDNSEKEARELDQAIDSVRPDGKLHKYCEHCGGKLATHFGGLSYHSNDCPDLPL